MIRIMPPRPHHLPEPPPAFPPLPDWTRTAGQCESPEDALFSAGAALAAIHPIACASHPITELWRQRLALASAEAVVRLQGRREDAATLRDYLYFTRPGDDPGPAGSVLLAWQMLAKGSILRPPAPDSDWRETLANLLSFTIDEAAEEAIDAPFAEGARCKNPLEAAISVAALSLRLRPDSRPLALWLADVALARSLNWPAPVPLFAIRLDRSSLTLAAGPQADPRRWLAACARAYGQAAAFAHDLYADLARRAERLLAIAPRLRGRDADETVLALLKEDALAARQGRAASDRSSRRLFGRLVSLGAVRELTGRPAFRLYGL